MFQHAGQCVRWQVIAKFCEPNLSFQVWQRAIPFRTLFKQMFIPQLRNIYRFFFGEFLGFTFFVQQELPIFAIGQCFYQCRECLQAI
jgi:hypothetical protein